VSRLSWDEWVAVALGWVTLLLGPLVAAVGVPW